MKRELLIKKLQAMPYGIDVVILDSTQNQKGADEEGSSAGIYDDFDLEVINNISGNPKRFAALSFSSDSSIDI
jgi:hypothetical protein